jgi:hypothetical protein
MYSEDFFWISTSRLNYYDIRAARTCRLNRRIDNCVAVRRIIQDSRVKLYKTPWTNELICEFDGVLSGADAEIVYDMCAMRILRTLYKPTLTRKLWSRAYHKTHRPLGYLAVDSNEMKRIHKDLVSKSKNMRLFRRRYL